MELSIVFGDITRTSADLVVMKHAEGFHGADHALARSIGFSDNIPVGQKRLLQTGRTSPPLAMFISVGPLYEFRYDRIQQFGSELFEYVEDASQQLGRALPHIAMTIHGPGYGLDTQESFLSLIAGLVEGAQHATTPVKRISIVERNEKRCNYLNHLLSIEAKTFGLTDAGDLFYIQTVADDGTDKASTSATIIQFGERASLRPHIFVAMPFSEDYLDEYEIGISEASRLHLITHHSPPF